MGIDLVAVSKFQITGEFETLIRQLSQCPVTLIPMHGCNRLGQDRPKPVYYKFWNFRTVRHMVIDTVHFWLCLSISPCHSQWLHVEQTAKG